MIGEISIFGVYMPTLLLLGLVALVLTGLLTRLFALTGVYRLVAYRPLVDLCVFLLLLGLLAYFSTPFGLHP
jgi:hypothetical protein